MKKSLYTILIFTKINTRRFFRDTLALFFTIGFPLLFLVIFGFLSKGGDLSFKVAIINQSNSAFSKQYVSDAHKNKLYKIDDTVTSLDKAEEKMKRSQIDATIILPPDFGAIGSAQYPTGQAKLLYTNNSAQSAQALSSVLQAQFKDTNAKLVPTAEPFTVVSQESNQRGLSRFDYTFSGLLGFSIIGLGVFGPVNVFPELKKQGILRRLHTTPLKVWQYFVSSMLSQAIIGVIALSISFAVGIGIFHLKVVGSYFELVPFIALSIIMMYGIGLAIGGWAKNERQSQPLGQIIAFPMLFLSGTFFPRYAMPEWLQHATNFLPLTPVIDGIRLITNEGKHLTDIGPQLGAIGIWLVVVYIIAFRVFRWE